MGQAIPLYDPTSQKLIYDMIEQQLRLYGEQYKDAMMKAVFIRLYLYYEPQSSLDHEFHNLSDLLISQILNVMDS